MTPRLSGLAVLVVQGKDSVQKFEHQFPDDASRHTLAEKIDDAHDLPAMPYTVTLQVFPHWNVDHDEFQQLMTTVLSDRTDCGVYPMSEFQCHRSGASAPDSPASTTDCSAAGSHDQSPLRSPIDFQTPLGKRHKGSAYQTPPQILREPFNMAEFLLDTPDPKMESPPRQGGAKCKRPWALMEQSQAAAEHRPIAPAAGSLLAPRRLFEENPRKL
jgi:hypothetical protein